MATLIKIVAGNTAPPFSVTVKRSGTAIDLTGCTVSIIIAKGSTITQAGGSCTITSASGGVISYSPQTTDFPTAGTYKADVKVTYGDGNWEIIYDQLKVKARKKLG